MLKWLTCLLTFALAQANEVPFWKAKAKVYERVQNREVIVAVTYSVVVFAVFAQGLTVGAVIRHVTNRPVE